MLDHGTTRLGMDAALEAIYAALEDPSEVAAALEVLCAASGAGAARLESLPAGKVIGQTARFAGAGAVSLTHIGPRDQRARLWLTEDCSTDLAMAERLLGHVMRALSHASLASDAERHFSVCSEALNRLAVGAVFLDAEGRVLRRAGLAQDVLSANDGLALRRDQIIAKNGSEDRALQNAIRNALSGAATEPVTLAISRPSLARDLGVIVQPLPQGAVVLIRDAERGSAPQNAILRQLFGMTPTEAELARNLSAGLTLDESAESMSISRNTARAHLRAIFSKSGITRQTELVRLMLSSAAVLAPPMMDQTL